MVAVSDEPEVLTGFAPLPPVIEANELSRIREDLGERYDVKQYLARGGFASVWEAFDRVEELPVAVKRLDQKPSRSGDFYRELRAMFRLNHPNVVRLVNVLEAEGRRYLILELCEGESLRLAMSRARNRNQRWPIERVSELIAQMADGLRMAHAEGLTHRDIKPENALFARREEGSFGGQSPLKLADFGLASGMTPADDGRLRSVTGSPAYMAPEQFCGQFRPASDMYALGIVAFEMLTGDVPFHGMPNDLGYKHLRERPGIPSSLPSPWDTLLSRMLAKQTDERPTANELVERLRPTPNFKGMPEPEASVAEMARKTREEASGAGIEPMRGGRGEKPQPRVEKRLPKVVSEIATLSIGCDSLRADADRFLAMCDRRTIRIEHDGTTNESEDHSIPTVSWTSGELTNRRADGTVAWKRAIDIGAATGKAVWFADGSIALPRLLTRPEMLFINADGSDRSVVPLPGIPWQMQAGDGMAIARILTGRGFRLYAVRPDGAAIKLSQSEGAVAFAVDGQRPFAVWANGKLAEWAVDGRVRFGSIPEWMGSPRLMAATKNRIAIATENQIRLLQWGRT